MNNVCNIVVFSDKAYNSIICETFKWDPNETGGFLLGQVLDNGTWYVIEAIPPGYSEGSRQDRVFHEVGYFEPNTTFTEYMANIVANQYDKPLILLGLWHRHPGSMDFFSGTDDETNSRLAQSESWGIISGLVNVDPKLRLTMRHVPNDISSQRGRPNYEIVDVEVGSDLIPEEFLKLKYCTDEERDLHPYAPQRSNRPSGVPQPVYTVPVQQQPVTEGSASEGHIDGNCIVREQMARNSRSAQQQQHNHATKDDSTLTVAEDFIEKIKKNKKVIILILALIAFLFSVSSIKNDFSKGFHFWGSDDKSGETVVTEEVKTETSTEDQANVSDKDEKSEVDPESKDGQEKANEVVSASEKSGTDKSGKDAGEKTEETKTTKNL